MSKNSANSGFSDVLPLRPDFEQNSIQQERFSKSSDKSKEYLDKAKKSAVEENDIDHSLRRVNMAIAYAVDDSDLSRVHSTLTELKKLIKIQNLFLDKNEQPLKIKEDEEKIKEFVNHLFTLKCPNPAAPALEDFVHIKVDREVPSRGRHLVTTRDVPIGTTLCVEKPLDYQMGGLTDIFQMEPSRCYHCLKKLTFDCLPMSGPTPCAKCVFVLFCDKNCLNFAQNYHQYECLCFSLIFPLVAGHPEEKRWLFAFQLICKLGPGQLFQIFEANEEKSKTGSNFDRDPGQIPGVDPSSGIYSLASYYTVKNMKLSFGPVDPSAPKTAQQIVEILQENTNFFQQLDPEFDLDPVKTANFQEFIASALIDHTRLNCIFLKEKRGSGGSSHEYGAVLCPTLKLANHSCDPNVLGLKSGHSWVIVAARNIKAGEELCRSYNDLSFENEGKAERRLKLDTGYKIYCECHACIQNWPPLLHRLSTSDRRERSKFLVFGCVVCSMKLSQQEKSLEENWRKVVLTVANGFKCPTCGQLYIQQKMLIDLMQNVAKMSGVEQALLDIEIKEPLLDVLKRVREVCTFFQENLLPPSIYQIHAEALHRKAIDTILSWID